MRGVHSNAHSYRDWGAGLGNDPAYPADDIGIIPRFTGTLIHDCWASYFAYDKCRHGLCGAHLLRELAFVFESNSYRWARLMKKLLCEACHRVNTSETRTLDEAEYLAIRKRYRTILTRGAGELPEIPKRKKGQRGRTQSPMPTTCTSGSRNTKTPCCASCTTPMSASRTMREKGASGWQRSR